MTIPQSRSTSPSVSALADLADHDVREAAQMTRVLRTQIDVVLSHGAGVLNADDAPAAIARLRDLAAAHTH